MCTSLDGIAPQVYTQLDKARRASNQSAHFYPKVVMLDYDHDVLKHNVSHLCVVIACWCTAGAVPFPSQGRRAVGRSRNKVEVRVCC